MRRLSHSQVRMYLRCPQQWKLKYVDRLPEEPKPWFNLGSAVHAALEAFYDGRVAEPPPVEELEEVFRTEFDPEAYPDESERERRRADGVKMVEDFHAKHAPGFEPALAVEKRLDFELEGVPFVGFVDRVDRTEDDRLRIVDYKTGRGLDQERARTDAQLTLYQVGSERAFGREVAALCLYHVPTQTPFEAGRHGEERVEALRRRVRTVARGIREGAFEPDPGPYCDRCDFRPHCPAWAHEHPENWEPEQRELEVPTAEEARELADRYGSLKGEVDAREEELAVIRDGLERYFEATGARSVEGRRHGVKASRSVGHRFDDEELREVLEPAGLWKRVLRPDWRAEEALMDDPDVPEGIRRRMEEIARERVIWRLRAHDVEEAPAGDGRGDDP